MQRRRDLACATLLFIFGLLLQASLRLAFHADIPLGLDMDLWGFSVLDVGSGWVSSVPPAYPMLAAGLSWLSGCSNLWAAVTVSALAVAAVPPASFGFARLLGASWKRAVVVGCVAAVFPGVLPFGLMVSPDGLATLSLLAGAAAAAAFVQRVTRGRLVLFAVTMAFVSVTREHGAIAAYLGCLVAVAAPRRIESRLLALVTVLAALAFVPLVAGHPVALPGFASWSARLLLPIRDILSHTHDLTDRYPVSETDLGPLHTVVYAAVRAPESWIWVLLAGVALYRAPWAHRAAALVGVVPALAGLVVISEARHVWVVTPAAMALWLARPRATAGGRRFVLGAAALLALLAQARWVDPSSDLGRERSHADLMSVSSEIRRQLRSAHGTQEQSLAMCALSGDSGLWAGSPGAFAFCPMRQNRATNQLTAANLNTWYKGHQPPGPLWTRVEGPGFGMPVHRYMWAGPGQDRPCTDSHPHPDTPYRSAPARIAAMVPDCEIPESFVNAFLTQAGLTRAEFEAEPARELPGPTMRGGSAAPAGASQPPTDR